ncbi:MULTISPECIES: adenylate/guanylate cyclase domain-containing protein [unclassified Bradyrhizobium]|uniref:adenylate/guanylate cyclase domain-containing protein n=1 Tax=unclassified Bradyrhizobium TaxID=2631580 RepID=UPI001BAAC395|nr:MULTISPECIES: adenylate/guanylate cyclase domain-containing protein [unclassified Bradyrhizobium]MBR1208249.1 adenylate/guanylate cyclase domain-containing protein [Bradyrhizobium sp. AUGA SZCCT0124]MBR1316618.1 adenylate/guanylate cyclase domain-containing protein [Bradyrhizobium sp. AUGA SZCCT0051]MBR1344786.1 adenylate/guanylate cyclase domain-containing protein [Bradyrhizobium sp. AUGA SZCCT0105]MBR1359639.1 adenylate/guanylate cyclase domain-containing protein [Bradyrhizobium sp. AUGA S
MASPSREHLQDMARGIGQRQVRLVTGAIMFAYLISHFLNHALGNISTEAMAIGVHYHTEFWQFLPVAIVFYSACLVHTGLGIWALYQRREFHWKAIEPLQLVLGLSIPVFIIIHIVGVRLGQTLYGHEKLYPQELYTFFIASPARLWLMFAVLLIAWVHGCIGLYFWLRLRAFFRWAAPFLLATAVLIPTLAMLGIYQGGRATMEDYQDPDWRREELSVQKLGTAAQAATLEKITGGLTSGYLALLGLVLLARGARALLERRGGMIALSYGNGRTLRVPKGLSVLEASLRYNVPHASVCGGRARCSTCRIRIIGDHAALPEPSPREAFVLHRVGTDDPSIRLACQLRPTTDLAFFQLFLPHTMSANTHASNPTRVGQERYLVSMFVDMRGSTQLAEKRLPFDTVFIVNRFLGAVSQAVLEAGGRPNQFIGDGMLALFGLSTDRQLACRQALRAAALIAANIDELNQFLSHDLREPIRFGIGIHGGEVIVGDIGYRDHMVFTALGDAVNVAARLQDMTKALACEAVISDEVRVTAGLADDALPAQEVAIRGRNAPMTVRTVEATRVLSTLVDDRHAVAA